MKLESTHLETSTGELLCLLSFLILINCFCCHAQGTKPYNFTAEIGASFPKNEFASTNISSNKSGFADDGFAFKMSAGYNIFEHAGAAIQFFYTRNGVKQDIYKYAYGPLSSWETVNILFGLKFPFYYKSIFFEAHLFSGFASNSSPVLLRTNQTYFNEPRKTTSTPVEGGVTFGYQFKIVSLGISVDYYNTNAKFPDIKTSSGVSIKNTSFTQEYELVSICAVMRVKFGKR